MPPSFSPLLCGCLAPAGFSQLPTTAPGPAPDPRARFATYWPQLAAYADALRLTFPAHHLGGVAIHWMNEGSLSFLPLEPEVVA